MGSPAIEVVYREYERLVYGCVHAYRRVHGGVWQEVLSEAHYLFMTALASYDPQKGALSTWITWKVSRGLLDYGRSQRRHCKVASLARSELLAMECRETYPMERWLADLSADSCDLLQNAVEAIPEKTRYKQAYWRCLLEDLLQDGWSGARLARCLQEVAGVLG